MTLWMGSHRYRVRKVGSVQRLYQVVERRPPFIVMIYTYTEIFLSGWTPQDENKRKKKNLLQEVVAWTASVIWNVSVLVRDGREDPEL